MVLGDASAGPDDFSAYSGKAVVRLVDGTWLGEAQVMLVRSYERVESDGLQFTPGALWGYLEFEQPVSDHLAARITRGGERMVIGSPDPVVATYEGRPREFTPHGGPPAEIRVASVFDEGLRHLVCEAD